MEKRLKTCHLVLVPFTGVGVKGYSGDEWYKYRIEVFRDYTLKSLTNQKEKNFILWLSFRPEEEHNPLTKELADTIQEHGISYIMSFHGLMYHDDKFSKGFVDTVWNVGRIIRKCWRDNDWSGFTQAVKEVLYSDKNKTLPQRLGKVLPELKKYFGDTDCIYLTRVDSDDMFHKDAFRLIHNERAEFKKAIVMSKLGFFYNKTLDKFAEYRPKTNPPLHTIIFPSEVFFDVAKHMDYMKSFKSHEDIPKLFNCITLPHFYYCIFTDNTKHRISTTWNHAFKGKLIDTTYKIKEDFGI